MPEDPTLEILGRLRLRTARLTAMASTPETVAYPSPHGVSALAASPDGRRLAVGRNAGLQFLDAVTLEPVPGPELPVLEPKRLRFSRDGEQLFFQDAERAGTLGVGAGRFGFEVPGFRPAHDAFFAADASLIVRADHTHLAVFDSRAGVMRAEIAVGGREDDRGAPWRILDVAPDGAFALAVHWRQEGMIARRLDLATGLSREAYAPLPAPTGGGGAIAPGGTWAVVADGWGNFATIDLEAMRFATPLVEDGRRAVWSVVASPDGRHWASARTREITVWRLAAEHPLERVDLDPIRDVPRALAFGADGALLIGTAAGRVLRLELPRG